MEFWDSLMGGVISSSLPYYWGGLWAFSITWALEYAPPHNKVRGPTSVRLDSHILCVWMTSHHLFLPGSRSLGWALIKPFDSVSRHLTMVIRRREPVQKSFTYITISPLATEISQVRGYIALSHTSIEDMDLILSSHIRSKSFFQRILHSIPCHPSIL